MITWSCVVHVIMQTLWLCKHDSWSSFTSSVRRSTVMLSLCQQVLQSIHSIVFHRKYKYNRSHVMPGTFDKNVRHYNIGKLKKIFLSASNRYVGQCYGWFTLPVFPYSTASCCDKRKVYDWDCSVQSSVNVILTVQHSKVIKHELWRITLEKLIVRFSSFSIWMKWWE